MASSKITLDSPLGEAVVLRRMVAKEELGRLFSYEIDVLSTKPIKPGDLLGLDLTVKVDLPGDDDRYFHGYVTEIVATGGGGRAYHYLLKVHPWLWFLSRTSGCRIFQNKTVPQIVKAVCSDLGFTDIDERELVGTYSEWVYCVQYRETALAFVSRLLEQAGIYYYFRHEQGKHTMVLCDALGAHKTHKGYEQVPYYPPDPNARRERECLDGWQVTQRIVPGSYSLRDFNFERPKASLEVKLDVPMSHAHDHYERYDYPGEYEQSVEGDNYVRLRLEEEQADFQRFRAQGNARGLMVGALFELTSHPDEDQNAEYLVVDSRSDIAIGDYQSGSKDAGPVFRCTLTAIRSETPFRAERSTPKPTVYGPQTATVVGRAGEEITTDDEGFGRVKVQFHWDREGKSDENSSCWVRVSQAWAGSGWGAMHLPRIGQEVIVSFLEGDPDRPLITGRVYNGAARPPFDLPGKAMVSGIKSDSTPGGGGYNEISMDDTKGKEKIVVHGQFDMESTIEHDQTLTVHNNRTSTVDVDDTETVGNNQKVNVGVNQDVTVGSNQTLNVGANQAVVVGANATLSVAAKSDETVGAMKTVSIGAAYQISVGAAMNESVGGLKAEEVGGVKSVNVGAASSEIVAKSKSVKAGKNISEEAGADFSIKSGKKMLITSGDDFALQGKKKGVIEITEELTIKVGKATITLKKNGDVTINGKKMTMNASGDLVLKGSKITQN